MPLFYYKGKDEEGTIVEGETNASDKYALARALKQKNIFVISTHRVTGKKSLFSRLNFSTKGVKAGEKIMFIRNLGSMLEAGLPLTRALKVLERQTKNKYFKSVIKSLTEEIAKGNELNISMALYPRVFPKLTIAMVRAGEKSGTIAKTLQTVGEQLEQSYLLYKRVRGALIYPTIILIVMVVIGILMIIFVVPTLTATFKELGVELPVATKILIAVSDFLRFNILLSLAAVTAFGMSLYVGGKTTRGSRIVDYLVLHLPVIGTIAQQVNAARTTRTLSSLISSGVDIVEAISITKQVLQNSYYKDILKDAEERIPQGVPLSVVISEHEDIYPILVGEMIAVGEETGKLSEMMLNVAIFYETEVAQTTKDLSTVIEPILMVIIGGGVGFFAYSMITPLYSVLGGI